MANPQPSIRAPETVPSFLDRYARALTAGDSATVASMWEAPALVLGHSDIAIGSTAQVAQLFGNASDEYKKRGIAETRPVVEREDWLSDRLASVDVRWPYLDSGGQTVGGESSTYILRRDDSGELHIRVALTR